MIPKFRAWDKVDKVIREVTAIDWSLDLVEFMHGAIERSFDNVILMQSTGLKDKNGVEIFEGDIVVFTIENGFDYVYEKPGEITLSSEWGAGVRSISKVNYSFRECEEVRVIGNIIENPELLEVEG